MFHHYIEIYILKYTRLHILEERERKNVDVFYRKLNTQLQTFLVNFLCFILLYSFFH